MNINFNGDWRFKAFDVKNEAAITFPGEIDFQGPGWMPVTLPHTPKIEPRVVNAMWQGICCYHKTFFVEKSLEGKKLFLEFEGVMIVAEVWVNGEKLITHKGGYLPFTIDLSEIINYGADNTVIVMADNRDKENIPPGKPLKELDFCWYGGIYRNVKLIVKDKLHITDPVHADKTAGGGVFVTYPKITGREAIVQVQTDVQNDYPAAKSFSIFNAITDLNGKVIVWRKSLAKQLEPGRNCCIADKLEVKDPLLWSPESPSLYNLETAIIVDNKKVDKAINRIGIRRFQISSEGFYINGEKMYLRGSNRHQEYPFIGYALSDNAQYRDARLIKDAGFDIVRLSHYPQATAFLNACDELGLLVINAIPGWQFYQAGEFADLTLRNAREMIRRDRNHASVILWETSLNETYNIPDDEIKRLHEIVHEEIPGDQAYSCGWKDKHYDVFIPARQHTDGPAFWNDWRNGKKAIFTAEYGDFEYLFYDYTRSNFDQTRARARNVDESSRQPREAGEKRLLQQAFNFQESHNQNQVCKSMIGDANWVFADYNRGVRENLCESGVVDIFRLPKFVYYFYQSQRDAAYQSTAFNAGPMAFIATYWDKNSANKVKVFSNCDEVELALNGKVLEKRFPDKDEISRFLNHPPFTFNVKYEHGQLKATGYIEGVKQAEHAIITPDIPCSIELDFADCGKPLAADGADTIFVHARIIDKNGTLVPDAANKVSFSVEGAATLLGENPVSASGGIASMLLQGALCPGEVKVTAFSPELKTASKTIASK